MYIYIYIFGKNVFYVPLPEAFAYIVYSHDKIRCIYICIYIFIFNVRFIYHSFSVRTNRSGTKGVNDFSGLIAFFYYCNHYRYYNFGFKFNVSTKCKIECTPISFREHCISVQLIKGIWFLFSSSKNEYSITITPVVCTFYIYVRW
jgi:hypothetical protein